MREQHGGRERQRSVLFWIPWWWSDHLLPMCEGATGWKKQAYISNFLNSPMTITPLTSYQWESNGVEHTDWYKHHSECSNNNHTTYPLQIRDQHGEKAEISTILNSLMKIKPLTSCECECNMVKQTGKDQPYPEFSNVNQITYKLWRREQQGGVDEQILSLFWIPW